MKTAYVLAVLATVIVMTDALLFSRKVRSPTETGLDIPQRVLGKYPRLFNAGMNFALQWGN